MEASAYQKAHFEIIRLVHEVLYRPFVNPYEWLGASGITSGKTVLEVGSGPGFFTLPAAELVGEKGHVYALDNNPAAVDYVEHKVVKYGARNVSVLLGDAANTGIQGGSVDVVLYYGVIHDLWDELDAVMAEAHRVLKENGTVSVSSSRVPQDRIIRAVTASGLFRLAERTKRVVNFGRSNEAERR
jgi:ubiquinone/menaquinone biosynthesis C-methylase UbiE